MSHIVLYADEFDYDVWMQYCDICDVSYDATYIDIAFNPCDVESNG